MQVTDSWEFTFLLQFVICSIWVFIGQLINSVFPKH